LGRTITYINKKKDSYSFLFYISRTYVVISLEGEQSVLRLWEESAPKDVGPPLLVPLINYAPFVVFEDGSKTLTPKRKA